jgi:hypothetical protein
VEIHAYRCDARTIEAEIIEISDRYLPLCERPDQGKVVRVCIVSLKYQATVFTAMQQDALYSSNFALQTETMFVQTRIKSATR